MMDAKQILALLDEYAINLEQQDNVQAASSAALLRRIISEVKGDASSMPSIKDLKRKYLGK